jgi:hypothetical protein
LGGSGSQASEEIGYAMQQFLDELHPESLGELEMARAQKERRRKEFDLLLLIATGSSWPVSEWRHWVLFQRSKEYIK